MEAGPPFSLHSTIQASMLNTLGARGRFIVHRIRDYERGFSGKVQEGSQGMSRKVSREGTERFSGKVQEGSQGRCRMVLREGTERFSGKVHEGSQGK